MQLPEDLFFALEEIANSIDRKDLYKSAEALSLRYRKEASSDQVFIKNYEEAVAYLCTRFPATFAANYAVFSELQKKGLEEEIQSVLDIGSGSGAAFWAASQVLSQLKSYSLLERDVHLVKIGKALLQAVSVPIETSWIVGDYTKSLPKSSHDLVVLSYSLGEVDSKLWDQILGQIFEYTQKMVVILEPGTPLGYKKLMKMRDILIGLGGSVVAPCPHSRACPLLGSGDWCHFSQRLPRTSLHRLAKNASLGFEDEKYSYLIVSKNKFTGDGERVLRYPSKQSGFIEWEACSSFEGLVHRKAMKRDKEAFNKAKKLDWGSFYETPSPS